MPKLNLVYDNSGDWMGIYLDTKLVYQNHSIEAEDLLVLLGIKYETMRVDLQKHNESHLPNTFEECEKLK